MMNCKQVTNLLSQYMEGDLSPRDASQVQAHILACRSCADALEKLTKAVETLEAMPTDEPQVDLYNAFRSRLARSPRKRRLILLLPSTRRWAVAGMALVLLLGGSLIGSWLKRPEILYVSRLRSAGYSAYSSIAIAAETAQNRWDVDSPLFADSRLLARIDVKARGETLGKVLDVISRRSGVDIKAAPEVASQRVYLRLSDVQIAEALAKIRRLLDLDWRITETKSGRRYELICTEHVKRMSSAVAKAQAISLAEETLRRIQQAIERRDPSLIEKLPINCGYCLSEDLRKLQTDPNHTLDQGSVPYFLIDDEVISTLMAGQRYVRPYGLMTPTQKSLFRRWLYHEARVPNAKSRMIIRLVDMDDGSINLQFENDWGYGTSTTGTSVFSPTIANRDTNMLTPADLDEVYRNARESSARYDDPRINVNLGNGVYGDSPIFRHKPTYTLMEMLDLITERTNLSLLADHYTIQEQYNRMLPREITLGELLALLDHDFNIAWDLSADNTLRLVHRQWPLLQGSEPDMALVQDLESSLRSEGKLTMSQMARLSGLTKLRLNGTMAAVGINGIHGYAVGVVENMRRQIAAYASLRPDQIRTLESSGGLPSSALSTEQRRLFCLAAHDVLYGCSSNYKPSDLEKRFAVRLIRKRCSGREVEKMVGGKLFMSGGGIMAGGENFSFWTDDSGDASNSGVTKDYVVMKFTGDYDCSAAFSMPRIE